MLVNQRFGQRSFVPLVVENVDFHFPALNAPGEPGWWLLDYFLAAEASAHDAHVSGELLGCKPLCPLARGAQRVEATRKRLDTVCVSESDCKHIGLRLLLVGMSVLYHATVSSQALFQLFCDVLGRLVVVRLQHQQIPVDPRSPGFVDETQDA